MVIGGRGEIVVKACSTDHLVWRVVRPRAALCGCYENTLLWDVETVLYGRWRLGRSRLASYYEGMSSGSSGGISRLFIVMSMCDYGL